MRDTNTTDVLKVVVLTVAAIAFLASVGAKLFTDNHTDIGNVSTVFLGASSLVLGASGLSSYFNRKIDK